MKNLVFLLLVFLTPKVYGFGFQEFQMGQKLRLSMVQNYHVKQLNISAGQYERNNSNSIITNGKISLIYDNVSVTIESNYLGDISGVQVSYNLKTTKQIEADISNFNLIYQGVKMTSNDAIGKSFTKNLTDNYRLVYFASASTYNGQITNWSVTYYFR